MPFEIPSEFWGIGGFVVGVIGLIVGAIGAYIGFVGRKKFLMEYKISSTQLVSEEMSNIPGLKILFNDQKIESLISSTVTFTNAGNETINGHDLAKNAPIRIVVSGHFLVGDNGYHISASNPNSAPILRSIDDTTYELGFDFLKKKTSFKAILLHDGKLTVSGELKSGEFREQSARSSKTGLLILVLLPSLLTVLIFVLQSHFFYPQYPYTPAALSSTMIIIIDIVLVLLFPRYKDR